MKRCNTLIPNGSFVMASSLPWQPDGSGAGGNGAVGELVVARWVREWPTLPSHSSSRTSMAINGGFVAMQPSNI